MVFNPMAAAVEQANAAIEAARAERQANDQAEAQASWAEKAEIIEDSLEYAGISAVDVVIDGSGYAQLNGSVSSEAQQATAVGIAEQFELMGLEVNIDVHEPAPEIIVEHQPQAWIVESPAVVVEEVPSGPSAMVHTTLKGESWWGIANRYYGNGRLWKKLKKANGSPKMLHPGQDLVIPPEGDLDSW